MDVNTARALLPIAHRQDWSRDHLIYLPRGLYGWRARLRDRIRAIMGR
ncbi:MAG: hypothetical protein ACPGID_02520 [Rubricella sp.]